MLMRERLVHAEIVALLVLTFGIACAPFSNCNSIPVTLIAIHYETEDL